MKNLGQKIFFSVGNGITIRLSFSTQNSINTLSRTKVWDMTTGDIRNEVGSVVANVGENA